MAEESIMERILTLPPETQVMLTVKWDSAPIDLRWLLVAINEGYLSAKPSDEGLIEFLMVSLGRESLHTWPDNCQAPRNRTFTVTTTGKEYKPLEYIPGNQEDPISRLAWVVESFKVA